MGLLDKAKALASKGEQAVDKIVNATQEATKTVVNEAQDAARVVVEKGRQGADAVADELRKARGIVSGDIDAFGAEQSGLCGKTPDRRGEESGPKSL